MNGLTREQILAMEPGRELDALVAENVMGWKANLLKTDWWEEINPNTHHHKGLVKDFDPSRDISAAWEVVEKMQATHICKVIGKTADFEWFASFQLKGDGVFGNHAYAPTAPLAICRAALLAVMDK